MFVLRELGQLLFDDGGVTDGKFCKKITASLPWITSLKSQHKDCEVLFFRCEIVVKGRMTLCE